MQRTTQSEERAINNRLELLKKKDHIPADLLELVQAVSLRQQTAMHEAKVTLPPADQWASEERRLQGAPFLERNQLPFDAPQAEALFQEFMTLLDARGGVLRQSVENIRKAMTDKNILQSAIQAYRDGDDAFFTQFGEKHTPSAPRALSFLLQSSLTPSIAAGAQLLAKHHSIDAAWPHAHCPICGSLPLIGELREKEGLRYVACSYCRTSYRVPRLRCTFCGEDDHNRLSYFTADEEPGYRVEVCDTCKMYIKTADFREMDRKIIPVLDDLESLSLDILADNENYKRPTVSGFGF